MNKIQKLILSLQIVTVILVIAFISIVSYFIIDDYRLSDKYNISYIEPTVEDIIWDRDLLLSKETDDYFHNIALAYADLERKGEVIYEYSCIGYIEEYLRSK